MGFTGIIGRGYFEWGCILEKFNLKGHTNPSNPLSHFGRLGDNYFSKFVRGYLFGNFTLKGTVIFLTISPKSFEVQMCTIPQFNCLNKIL